MADSNSAIRARERKEKTVQQRLISIIADNLDVEEAEVTLNASFVGDLNADSLDLVELIMSIEEEFSTDGGTFEISDEEAETITTVQEALDFLNAHGISDA